MEGPLSEGPGVGEASSQGEGYEDEGEQPDGIEPGAEPKADPEWHDLDITIEHSPSRSWLRSPQAPSQTFQKKASMAQRVASSHPNVLWLLLTSGIVTCGATIRTETMFNTYIHMVTESTMSVGEVSSTRGIIEVILSFPAGWLSDKYSRVKVFRGCVVLSFFAAICGAYAISRDSIPLIYLSAGLEGSILPLNCLATSLLADSVSKSETIYFSGLLRSASDLAIAAGPAVSLTVFFMLGNEWSLPVLHWVFFLATLVWLLGNCLQIARLREPPDHPGSSQGKLPPALPRSARDQTGSSLLNGPNDDSISGTSDDRVEFDQEETEEGGEGEMVPYLWWSCRKDRIVPIVITASNLLTFSGAGMTVAFFPIFFKDALEFSPIELNILYLLCALSTCSFSLLAAVISSKIGAIQTICSMTALGIAAFIALILSPIDQRLLIAMFFVVRTGAMNGPYGVATGLVMASVPKNSRGKWSSLESVGSVTWSGSAALGGWLIGEIGFHNTFWATSCIYIMGLLLTLTLLVSFK